MRNIDGSEWLRNPELEVVETKTGQAVGSSFTLFADQVSTANDPDNTTTKKAPGKLASRGAP
jgi:hypothetical protein